MTSAIDDKAFHDELVRPETPGLPERFFDRFVFNMHPRSGEPISVLFGFGMYPPKNTVDGFVVVSDGTEQRNLRYSTELSATDGNGGGPFSFEVLEPNTTWRLVLAPNPIGVEFDLTWHSRTPAWFGEVAVTNTGAAASAFDHLFQSGYYKGTLTIDGETRWWTDGTVNATAHGVCAQCPAGKVCTSGIRLSSPIAVSVSSLSKPAITLACCSKALLCTRTANSTPSSRCATT